MYIRPEQITVLSEALRRRYYEQVCQFLRTRFPDITSRFDERTLLERVSVSGQTARTYGIRTARGMLAFVALSLIVGTKFDSDPQIRSFLQLPGDDPDSKIKWLLSKFGQKLRDVGYGRRERTPSSSKA